MLKLVIAALLAIAALVLAMNLLQTQMLFPTHAVQAAGPLPSGAARLELQTPGGERLHGVLLPASAGVVGSKILVLGFGGNGWNGQHVAEYLGQIYPDADVVAFHYRGYPPSTGSPSAAALIEDAPRIFDHAVAQVRPDRVIAVGFSIGSGVAANLARHRPVDGLILVTPFDSLKLVAKDLFPWLPVGSFFEHELAAADDLREIKTPVAMLAAGRDEIVAPSRTEALRRTVPNLVFDRTFEEAGHNDIYHRPDFRDAMREARPALIGKD